MIPCLTFAAKSLFACVRRDLERFDGKRLANVDALGCIPVEITASGVLALAASEHVKAILEDQPISLLAGPGH